MALIKSEETNAYRLIHGEGDGLPGLIIDIYNRVAVIQSHSKGIEKDVKLIKQAVQEELSEFVEKVHIRIAKSASEQEAEGKTEVLEHGNKFYIDYVHGQKTGFFIDQRENRDRLSTYSDGKKILNAFSYSGGFSIYALKANAREVHSLDSSKSAMVLVEENLKLNNLNGKNHKCIVQDALSYLNSDEAKDEAYDVVVLDPPALPNINQHVTEQFKPISDSIQEPCVFLKKMPYYLLSAARR